MTYSGEMSPRRQSSRTIKEVIHNKNIKEKIPLNTTEKSVRRSKRLQEQSMTDGTSTNVKPMVLRMVDSGTDTEEIENTIMNDEIEIHKSKVLIDRQDESDDIMDENHSINKNNEESAWEQPFSPVKVSVEKRLRSQFWENEENSVTSLSLPLRRNIRESNEDIFRSKRKRNDILNNDNNDILVDRGKSNIEVSYTTTTANNNTEDENKSLIYDNTDRDISKQSPGIRYTVGTICNSKKKVNNYIIDRDVQFNWENENDSDIEYQNTEAEWQDLQTQLKDKDSRQTKNLSLNQQNLEDLERLQQIIKDVQQHTSNDNSTSTTINNNNDVIDTSTIERNDYSSVTATTTTTITTNANNDNKIKEFDIDKKSLSIEKEQDDIIDKKISLSKLLLQYRWILITTVVASQQFIIILQYYYIYQDEVKFCDSGIIPTNTVTSNIDTKILSWQKFKKNKECIPCSIYGKCKNGKLECNIPFTRIRDGCNEKDFQKQQSQKIHIHAGKYECLSSTLPDVITVQNWLNIQCEIIYMNIIWQIEQFIDGISKSQYNKNKQILHYIEIFNRIFIGSQQSQIQTWKHDPSVPTQRDIQLQELRLWIMKQYPKLQMDDIYKLLQEYRNDCQNQPELWDVALVSGINNDTTIMNEYFTSQRPMRTWFCSWKLWLQDPGNIFLSLGIQFLLYTIYIQYKKWYERKQEQYIENYIIDKIQKRLVEADRYMCKRILALHTEELRYRYNHPTLPVNLLQQRTNEYRSKVRRLRELALIPITFLEQEFIIENHLQHRFPKLWGRIYKNLINTKDINIEKLPNSDMLCQVWCGRRQKRIKNDTNNWSIKNLFSKYFIWGIFNYNTKHINNNNTVISNNGTDTSLSDLNITALGDGIDLGTRTILENPVSPLVQEIFYKQNILLHLIQEIIYIIYNSIKFLLYYISYFWYIKSQWTYIQEQLSLFKKKIINNKSKNIQQTIIEPQNFQNRLNIPRMTRTTNIASITVPIESRQSQIRAINLGGAASIEPRQTQPIGSNGWINRGNQTNTINESQRNIVTQNNNTINILQRRNTLHDTGNNVSNIRQTQLGSSQQNIFNTAQNVIDNRQRNILSNSRLGATIGSTTKGQQNREGLTLSQRWR